jgi:hypothetical protein
MVKKYRKKPIVIEAMKLEVTNTGDVLKWIADNDGSAEYWSRSPMRAVTGIKIKTLEGDMIGEYDDFIIKGIENEFYPCKPDIFKATYEEVGDEAQSN